MKRFLLISILMISAYSVPSTMTYQGKLTDASGLGINDTLPMIFKLYTASSGGISVWEEGYTGSDEIVVDRGLFSVELGAIAPLELDFSEEYYLELVIDGDVMFPRQALSSSAYSFYAGVADSLAGGAGDDWGSQVINTDATLTGNGTVLSALSIDRQGALDGEVLKWNDGLGGWFPGTDETGGGVGFWEIDAGTTVGDSAIVPSYNLGLKMYQNEIISYEGATHVCLGVACTTGFEGMDRTYITVSGGYGNAAGSQFGVIAGGDRNKSNNLYGVISGGRENRVNGVLGLVSSGYNNIANDSLATVLSGANNQAQGKYSTVLGGGGPDLIHGNKSIGEYSLVGGGQNNDADSSFSVVLNGVNNYAGNVGAFIGSGTYNRATGSRSVIAGGYYNNATGTQAFVGSGNANRADGMRSLVGSGQGNEAEGLCSAIAGGVSNRVTDSYSFIGGGAHGKVHGRYSSIVGGGSGFIEDSVSIYSNYSIVGGGAAHKVYGHYAVIGGGRGNSVIGEGGTIGGGKYNYATDSLSGVFSGMNNHAADPYSVVCGGGGQSEADSNSAKGHHSFVGGGRANRTSANYATLTGGSFNNARGLYSFIGSGNGNDANSGYSLVGNGNSNVASGSYSTVLNGHSNRVYSHYSIIGGGSYNYINSMNAFIGSGKYNKARGNYSAIVAGGGASEADSNSIKGENAFIGAGKGNRIGLNGFASLIVAGEGNTVTDSFAVVTGGKNNAASGKYSAILGGQGNEASGDYSIAMGEDATVTASNSFIWNDGTAPVTISSSRTFRVNADNGSSFLGNSMNGALKGVNNGGYDGLWGATAGTGVVYAAIYANNSATGWGAYIEGGTEGSGYFSGDVDVNGNISKSGGSFKIDHPLDPENKYLYHSFVESPDMKNIYDGVVTLDREGRAEVILPDWFSALNSDYCYQLTCIGGYAQVYIDKEIEGNRFSIAGGKPAMKVSWQVTGIRKDPWAENNRIPVEKDKEDWQKGRYIHPTLYGQPEEMGIYYRSNTVDN